MIVLNIRPNLSPLHRALSDLGAKQMPFATMLALNRLASGVSQTESDAVRETFENPTPFTQRGFFVTSATKARPIAFVSAKDIQAQYLRPYLDGGLRFLGSKRAMLVPKSVATNQYGNLSRNKLKSLKGKPGIFIGPVKTKSGETINGVWQRAQPAKLAKGGRKAKIARPVGGLKLLIRFEDTTPVPKHFPFVERARAYLHRNARGEFERALREAVASARRR